MNVYMTNPKKRKFGLSVLSSEHGRYDFGIVYTHMFFGKPLVVCMQRRSSLLSLEDAENLEYLQKIFSLRSNGGSGRILILFKAIFQPLPSMQKRNIDFKIKSLDLLFFISPLTKLVCHNIL